MRLSRTGIAMSTRHDIWLLSVLPSGETYPHDPPTTGSSALVPRAAARYNARARPSIRSSAIPVTIVRDHSER